MNKDLHKVWSELEETRRAMALDIVNELLEIHKILHLEEPDFVDVRGRASFVMGVAKYYGDHNLSISPYATALRICRWATPSPYGSEYWSHYQRFEKCITSTSEQIRTVIEVLAKEYGWDVEDALFKAA